MAGFGVSDNLQYKCVPTFADGSNVEALCCDEISAVLSSLPALPFLPVSSSRHTCDSPVLSADPVGLSCFADVFEKSSPPQIF